MKKKFKAWDKNLKRMWLATDVQALPMRDFAREDLVWCQFIGQYDKNGTEIYESDVIYGPAANEFGSQSNTYGCPFWCNTHHAFEMDSKASGLMDVEKCEVVGNKFEHSNLLE